MIKEKWMHRGIFQFLGKIVLKAGGWITYSKYAIDFSDKFQIWEKFQLSKPVDI